MACRSRHEVFDREIGGWKAKLAPELRAMDHRAGQGPGMAEQHRRAADIAPLQRLPRCGRRDGFERTLLVSDDFFDNFNRDAELWRRLAQKLGRAGSTRAEMEIIAYDNGPTPRRRTRISRRNSPASRFAKALSKVRTNMPSRPSSAMRWALASRLVRRKTASPGQKNRRDGVRRSGWRRDAPVSAPRLLLGR